MDRRRVLGKITDEDIEFLKQQAKRQKDETYKKLSEMELKIAKAVKELQDD